MLARYSTLLVSFALISACTTNERIAAPDKDDWVETPPLNEQELSNLEKKVGPLLTAAREVSGCRLTVSGLYRNPFLIDRYHVYLREEQKECGDAIRSLNDSGAPSGISFEVLEVVSPSESGHRVPESYDLIHEVGPNVD